MYILFYFLKTLGVFKKYILKTIVLIFNWNIIYDKNNIERMK